MLIPGVDFTTIGKFVDAYFKCVNDNGGINGRPIKYILYNEQLNRRSRPRWPRSSSRATRSSGSSATRASPSAAPTGSTYKSKGFTVIGAGLQAECFGTPTFVESNMGPALQQHRRRPGAREARREVAHGGLARHDLGVMPTAALLKVAAAAGIPARRSRSSFRSRTPTRRSCSSVAGGRRRRRGHPRLHRPTRRRRLLQAAIAQGLVDKVLWARRRRSPNEFMAKQFPQFDGKMHINQEFGNITDGSPDEVLYSQITKKYRRRSRCSVRPDGLHGRQVRDPGPAEHQGSHHCGVV